MLEAAQRRRADGVDLVVALWRPTGAPRPSIAGRSRGGAAPRVDLPRGRLTELDLDAVLARNPSIALVDELAHSNVPNRGTPSAGRTWRSCWRPASRCGPPSTFSTWRAWPRSWRRSPGSRWAKGCPTAARPGGRNRADRCPARGAPSEAGRRKVYVPEQAARATQLFFRSGNLVGATGAHAAQGGAARRRADAGVHDVALDPGRGRRRRGSWFRSPAARTARS